ncbi:hypothetical protein GCM10010168_52130 [Actinoplanes ianthinogenes]|uniref:CBM2 domain-containing protein n=1 Tax=Actinoplanes ianthinogenes TaxID=122358 RepID=A0ABN6CQ40_9ACTN|nr:cellulose binding domain-containing protein [Actinoplanes ianthinogenes]BCJ46262.1 hypothetical protein Aiant_69190 [Actinoplanes ianthinogenes]GGR27453.1 hypothetical protein GCM10010168_52130 [Actinoplanes ianthinogenes]
MSEIFRVLATATAVLALAVPAGAAAATPSTAGDPVAACAIDYGWVQVRPLVYIGSVAIHNTGTAVINGWTLSFPLREPQRVISSRTATFASLSDPVIAHNIESNGVVAPGSAVTVTFAASGVGTAVTDFTVNGTACTLTAP